MLTCRSWNLISLRLCLQTKVITVLMKTNKVIDLGSTGFAHNVLDYTRCHPLTSSPRYVISILVSQCLRLPLTRINSIVQLS